MMFYMAEIFNQPIGGWDMSMATDTGRMFQLAEDFNQDISSWNTGNIGDMEYMFRTAYSFDQDLSCWDVGKIDVEPTDFFRQTAHDDRASSMPIWGTEGC